MWILNFPNTPHLGKKKFLDYLKKVTPLYKLIMTIRISSSIYETSNNHVLKLP